MQGVSLRLAIEAFRKTVLRAYQSTRASGAYSDPSEHECDALAKQLRTQPPKS